MRYILEKVDMNTRSINTLKTKDKWKEVASSNYIEMLIGMAGEMERIIDIKTGNVVYQTSTK